MRRLARITARTVVERVIPALLIGAGIAFVARGVAVSLGVEMICWGTILIAWSALLRATWRRAVQAGHRQARHELWTSFHEAVLVRRMHPAQWLAAEAERDEPRIAYIVAHDAPPPDYP